jgi:hypothetical protein
VRKQIWTQNGHLDVGQLQVQVALELLEALHLAVQVLVHRVLQVVRTLLGRVKESYLIFYFLESYLPTHLRVSISRHICGSASRDEPL